jgi:hypothetical protein
MLLCAIASTLKLPSQLPRVAFFLFAIAAAPIIFWWLSILLNPLVVGGGILAALATLLMLLNFVGVLIGLPLFLALGAPKLLALVPQRILVTTIRVLAVAFLAPYLWFLLRR